MYKEHELFQQPTSETKIWRYLNVERICSLLKKECLFFAKASFLDDPNEGIYPEGYPKNEGAAFNRMRFGVGFNQGQNYAIIDKDSYYICCFTMDEDERDDLWKKYLKKNEGVAIQLTLDGLKSCFDPIEDEEIFIGTINYEWNPTDVNSNAFYPFLHKMVEYAFEQELRAVIIKFLPTRKKDKDDKGVFIPIKLRDLLQKIVLSPNASQAWEVRLRSLCINKGLGDILTRSNLEEKPNSPDRS